MAVPSRQAMLDGDGPEVVGRELEVEELLALAAQLRIRDERPKE
ncbi:MAG TPA: hypothetical protein VNJ53_02375 [Gaiellaceae bacterium]|nr:hypothetical protein [Gaiellaceae bacterium]